MFNYNRHTLFGECRDDQTHHLDAHVKFASRYILIERYQIFVDLCGGVGPILRAAWLNPLVGALAGYWFEREALAFLRKRGDF
jgi:hypothetical protein